MTNLSAHSETMSTPFAALHQFAGDRPDYAGLRGVLQSTVPFNNFVGLTILETGPTIGRVEIPFRSELTNAVGTLHAGVLFLAADMAGSAAFLGSAAQRLGDLTLFLLKDCRVVFLKPGRGNIVVTAVMDDRLLNTALSSPVAGKANCDAKAYLHDSTGTLIGKAYLEFVFAFSAPAGPDLHQPGNA